MGMCHYNEGEEEEECASALEREEEGEDPERPLAFFRCMFLWASLALHHTMADKGYNKKPLSRKNCGRRCYESRAHKLATLFAMTAGGSNAAQFPMMVIVYGGAPFLVAYLTFLGVVAFPIMRLQSNLAQFAGDGNRGIFSTVPLFIGLGYSVTAYAVVHAVADTAQLSDALSLLLSWTRSFNWPHDCPGGWITRNLTCYTVRRDSAPCQLLRGRLVGNFRRHSLTEGMPVASGDEVPLVSVETYKVVMEDCVPSLLDIAPPYDFRRQSVWDESPSDVSREEPLYIVAAIWAVVFATAHRGILRIKTVFYVFITLHMTSTLLLLVRASTLAGAVQGLHVLLHPNWTYITNLEMWYHALYVSVESVGVTGTIYLGIERLNCFKNRLQEDVVFVLVADTASKGIGTVTSFLFLGHLSDSTGISVHMLVHADFNLVVSITPQVVSLVPHPEFWSRVHYLWVVTLMMPKFLIVPDIIIEVLSVSFPPILVKRRVTHFYTCLFLFFASFAVGMPGGTKMVSVLSYHQNNFRLLLLVLEILVILQLYGVKRLGVDSRFMTDEEPGFFVKLCWTSLTPVILLALLWMKLMPSPTSGKRHYPLLLTAFITWLEAVEISCILVYAFIYALFTDMGLRDCLVPLPTWVPDGWELAMFYRQQLIAEDTDLATDVERRGPTARPKPPPKRRRLSGSHSSSDLLGTHLILTSEAVASPSTSDWRYDSSDEQSGKPSVKWRSSEPVIRESGTFHKSLSLSAVRRAARSKAGSNPPRPRAVLRSKAVRSSAASRSSRRPSESGHPALLLPLPVHENESAQPTAAGAPKSPEPDADHLSVEACDYALHVIGDLFRELEHPAYSTLRQRSAKAQTDLAEIQEQLSGRPSLCEEHPVDAKALSPEPEAAAPVKHVPGLRSPKSREDKPAPSEKPVLQPTVAKSAVSDAAPAGLSLPEGPVLPPPSPMKEAARPGLLNHLSPIDHRVTPRGSMEVGGAQHAQRERPQHDVPKRRAKKALAHKHKTARSPHDGAVASKQPSLPTEAVAKNMPSGAASPVPRPTAGPSNQKSPLELAFNQLEKAPSPAPPPLGAKTITTEASGKRVASPPATNQVGLPRKLPSPARKTRRSPEAAVSPLKAAPIGKARSQKAAHAKLHAGRLSNEVLPVVDVGNASAVPQLGQAPKPKAKKRKIQKEAPKKKAHDRGLPEGGGPKAQDNAAVVSTPAGGPSKGRALPQSQRRSQRESTMTVDSADKLTVAHGASTPQPGGVGAAASPSAAKQTPVTAEPHMASAITALPPENQADNLAPASPQVVSVEGAKRVDTEAGSGHRSLENDRIGAGSSAPDGVP